MNSDLIADRLFVNRSETNVDASGNETEVPNAAEIARAVQKRNCELFEGGLGI